ncbi:MAG: hypothetical protein M0P59_09475 [Gallionella sp.]|jgi:hypothetical protein|nr:hypothetical protein [Gallionella sp.]MCK9354375.1 hypothetical protein [Gallionella sp.]
MDGLRLGMQRGIEALLLVIQPPTQRQGCSQRPEQHQQPGVAAEAFEMGKFGASHRMEYKGFVVGLAMIPR